MTNRSKELASESALKELAPFPHLTQKLLALRGIKTHEEADRFLNPDYDLHLHDPFEMKDMDRAVSRILQAIEANEKIMIYSDYDADGIPGAVVFNSFFKKIGFSNFEHYIPHRHDEGFGLHLEAVDSFPEKGVKLLITVDCGIADVSQVKRAQEIGIDVIVTDHHEPNGKVPPAFAILNPKQADCSYEADYLCGAGVAFKFVQGILKKNNFGLKAGMEKWFLDMVGLATLSDMVPLRGENRVLAYYGIRVLRKSPRPGLTHLLRKLNINQRFLTEDDIAFMITPRINAASRMGHPMDAFTLLSTDDEVEAGQAVEHLNKINDERKGVVASIVKDVRKHIKNCEARDGVKGVVVAGNPDWRPSLLGLVAGTLAEDFKRPVFLWGRDGGNVLKGSCRSDGATDLVALMEKAKGAFMEFGGHMMAGGFSVSHEKIHGLDAALNGAFEKTGSAKSAKDSVWIDDELSLDDVTAQTWREIEKLSPFGVGNPKPTFLFKKSECADVRMFGKQNNHLELSFKNSRGAPVKAIGFFMKPEQFTREPRAGEKIDLVATLEQSFWRGRSELRLRIVDIL